MITKVAINNESKILTAIFLLTVSAWVILGLFTNFKQNDLAVLLLAPETIIPIIGGAMGLFKARKWGGFSSALGRSLIALSLGLITWGGGMLIWDYYLFFAKVEIPYPSIADASFILSWPLWSYGLFELSKATGAIFGLRENKGKFLLLVIPVAVIIASYYLLFIVARGGQLDATGGGVKFFFDVFYPIGDVVFLTFMLLVFVLSKKYLGGQFKLPILILFLGFLLNYVTDFLFSFTTTVGTYYNGNFVDLLFVMTMYVLSLGVNDLDPRREN